MRNRTLDMIKAVCAYFVVMIHISFPGTVGNIVDALARFAVPVFFMVSGYFCYRTDGLEFEKTGKKLKHIAVLNVTAFTVYFMWELFRNHIEGVRETRWLMSLVSRENIREFFLYNYTSPVKWHLWFLPALLYCYVLFAFVARFRLYKVAYILIPVLLAVHFYMEELEAFTGVEYRTMMFRNYLFTGFPFFMLGHRIHKDEKSIREKLSPRFMELLLIVGAVSSVAEYAYLGKQELFMGSVMMAVSIFVLAILKKKSSGEGVYEGLAQIGSTYAFFIYLFHICAGDMLKDVAGGLSLLKNPVYLWSRPVLVCILVTVAAGVYFTVFSQLKPVISRRNVIK